MREKEAYRLYHIELFSGLAIYTVLLVVALRYSAALPEGMLRIALMVSPMIGFGLGVRAIARQLARSDEYIRLRTLEAVAIAAAVTAGLTFTYGFLENTGMPRLSMFTVWPLMGAVWGVVVILRRVLNR
ncbi:hypothetical protein [Massilia sp. CF038]|jgi:hypothetical protein|uniref:hypothetical protein n=1 Tax=Massilia sp. CF038 TaxID=1881045 RepID=UPI00091EDAE9|nr:hypothetical protein [Massilia sp. CF038]SHH69968.1 hypothetical protein SAMN05428948_5000 [Massilia sp. CF038]